MAKKLIYQNLESLEPLNKLLSEASSGLSDPTRTIQTSSMPEVLGAALGAGAGATVSFISLYFAGTVGLSAAGITSGLAAAGAIIGGGMAAGVFVLAAPIAILGVAGYKVVADRNRKRLMQAKEALIQQIIVKRDLVLRQLAKRVSLSEERARYLESLNTSLTGALNDLQRDLSAR